MLRLRLLGTLTGENDGRPVTMPASERARALIGWLALHPGSHPRAAVAARLWPDSTEASARANLRTAVWQIRQAWGPVADALVSSRTEIGLHATAVSDGDGDLLPGITEEWAEPDFPMAQRLDADPADGRVTISCLVSDLLFRWRLRPDGERTEVTVDVELPDREAHHLPAQRDVIERSLAALASLAARRQHRRSL
jgi:hypothetical protein